MNSGKSLEVLKVAHNYEEQGKKVLLFTPEINNRDGEGKIASRIGISRDAIMIDEHMNIAIEVHRCLTKGVKVNCVLIDEAQFLTKEHVYQLTEIADKFDIPVIAYGLKNTFDNKLFEGSKALLIYANKIEEIKTVCYFCDKKAIHNLRIDKNGNAVTEGKIIQIGGNESYIPVCRKCYKEKTHVNRLKERLSE